MPVVLLFEGKIDGKWKALAYQRCGDPPATISNNKEDGRREVYVTQCFADHATISRLPGGIDIVNGHGRIIDATELAHAILVRRLALGESIKMIFKPNLASGGIGERRVVRYRCVMLAP